MGKSSSFIAIQSGCSENRKAQVSWLPQRDCKAFHIIQVLQSGLGSSLCQFPRQKNDTPLYGIFSPNAFTSATWQCSEMCLPWTIWIWRWRDRNSWFKSSEDDVALLTWNLIDLIIVCFAIQNKTALIWHSLYTSYHMPCTCFCTLLLIMSGKLRIRHHAVWKKHFIPTGMKSFFHIQVVLKVCFQKLWHGNFNPQIYY